jgi:type VI secretion system protein ImpL
LSKVKEASPLLLVLVLLALLIWVVLPWIPYIGTDAVWIRALIIALIVGLALAVVALGQWRSRRKSDQIAGAVAQQASPAGAPSRDIARLREQFDEAIARLRLQRKRGGTLYDLPWFVFVGPPGSGKTTALVKSGLRFPLERGGERTAVKGVGGTRNCDWWFTDEAVFLDTAGRYFTQDSDATADSAGWREFLALLRKHRKRRPINGIILTVSAPELLSGAIREDEVEAARLRLRELNEELGIQVPVYVMVTKCDLVLGFVEFFDDLTGDDLAQVLGFTFPYEASLTGSASGQVVPEFDRLVESIRGRLLTRLGSESDVGRRTRIFGFPQQLAVMRGALADFVEQVFTSTRFDGKLLLRGVYFTSGTQHGMPLDRLLGTLAKRLAVPEAAMAPGRGKAYFVGRLLRDVLLEEAGLAGTNRRVEARKAALQIGAYAALIAITVLGALALWVSYRGNRDYLARVEEAVTRSRADFAADPSTPDGLVRRVNAFQQVSKTANEFSAGTPWHMRLGLFQGETVGAVAAGAYRRELNDSYVRYLIARFKQRIQASESDPAWIYLYLKGLLLLGHPEHLREFNNDEQLRKLARLAVRGEPHGDALLAHLPAVLDVRTLQGVDLDEANDPVIRRARGSIERPSKAGILYYDLVVLNQDAPRLTFESLDMYRVFKRGGGLEDGVEGFFTKDVFQQVVKEQLSARVKQLESEDWVWGTPTPRNTSRSLFDEVVRIYEERYIERWQKVLAAIQFQPTLTAPEIKAALAALGARERSPLLHVYETVAKNTNFVKPPDAPAKDGDKTAIDRALQGARSEGTEPGARITAAFAETHRFVTAYLPSLIDKLAQLGQAVAPIGVNAVGGPTTAEIVTRVSEVTSVLKQDAASLPPGPASLITAIAKSAEGAARGGVALTLREKYQVAANECRQLLTGRYPIVPASSMDLPLDDFASVFRSGGTFDDFFNKELITLVDTSREPWRWRTDLSGASVGGAGNQDILNQVSRVAEIRRRFFSDGGQQPKLTFWLRFGVVDTAVDRVVLTLDGKSVSYDHERPKDVPMEWPGQGPGDLTVEFQQLDSGASETVSFKGPWALFRLLDTSRQTKGDAVAVTVVSKKGRSAEILIKPSTQRHPFGRNTLAGFSC